MLPNTDFRQHPIWWEDSAPEEPDGSTPPPSCDVAVVGGGFAGLAAAFELAGRGAQVVVCEAARFGEHASARNSGGVSFGLDLPGVARWRRWTRSKGPPIAELARGALDSLTHLQGFIARHAIDCDFHMRGRLTCAATARDYDALQRRAETTNRLFDAGAYVLDRRAQVAEVGSDRFFGTMVIPRSGQLHPARYYHALLRLCRAAGATLCAGTPVEGIERVTGGFELCLPGRRLRAAQVLMATNAHAPRLGRVGLHRRVVPVASHIIVTKPLPREIVDRVLPNQRTGADTRRLLAYFRRTPDGRRFLYGGRAAPREVDPVTAARLLYSRMAADFPALDGVGIDYAWGCRVAFTFDRLPHLGLRDGITYIVGCNGNGVAMMNYLGYCAAAKIVAGGERTDCVFDQEHLPTLPGYYGRPWFLPVMAGAYAALDRRDARAADQQASP